MRIHIKYIEQISLVKRLTIVTCLIILSTFFIGYKAEAQILKDSATINVIKNGIDAIYSFEFENSEKAYKELNKSYPVHPVLLLYDGLATYWENYPLLPSSPARTVFEDDMRRCINLCEQNTDREHEAEYLLANLCARAMLLLFYDDNDLRGDVIPLAKSTYHYLRRSFRFTSECHDLFYFTGLYKYYREAFPLMHPFYKSVAFLFPPGDMAEGLRELEFAGVNSILLRAESYSILSWIYTNYELDFRKALYFTKALNDKYPANLLYRSYYLKNLLLLKQYDEAESLMKSEPGSEENSFYQAQLLIFNGIIQEKKYHNYSVAEDYYKKGINDISVYGIYGDDYAAYAYFGLSRICAINDNEHQKRIYHRKAVDLVDFRKVNFDD